MRAQQAERWSRGNSRAARRLGRLARYTTTESSGVDGMSVPCGDAKRVG
jgi:hypothetical protein